MDRSHSTTVRQIIYYCFTYNILCNVDIVLAETGTLTVESKVRKDAVNVNW